MPKPPTLDNITIRTELQPGDLGYITYLHGDLYKKEYGYGIEFESYVAEGLNEFYRQFNPARNRIWMCEDNGQRIGFLLLLDRGDAAQLRYFIIAPGYRSIGLGNKLMNMYKEFMKECGFRKSYLWTTSELGAAAHLYKKHGFVLVEEKPSNAFGKPVVENRYEFKI